MATKAAPKTMQAKPKPKPSPLKAKPAPAKGGAKPKPAPTEKVKSAQASPSASPAKAKAVAVAKAKKDPSESKPKRTFRVIMSEIDPKVDPDQFTAGGGKYVGVSPLQAARKAFRAIAAKYSKTEECSYRFAIQETTEMSKKSTFRYIGERSRRTEPQTVTKTGKTFPVNYDTHVKSWKGVAVPPVKKRRARKTAEPEEAPVVEETTTVSVTETVEQNGHDESVEDQDADESKDEPKDAKDEGIVGDAIDDEQLSEDEELEE